MDYELLRIGSARESSGSVLFALARGSYGPLEDVSRSFRCFAVEDQWQATKVPKETRIPIGRYEIKLRTEGGMHARYLAKYQWHRGMLWLQDVPGFTFVYIHTGNKESETDGCILVGNGLLHTAEEEFENSGSVAAYTRLYQEIVKSMDRERVFLRVTDFA